jgi:hypothetical protein
VEAGRDHDAQHLGCQRDPGRGVSADLPVDVEEQRRSVSSHSWLTARNAGSFSVRRAPTPDGAFRPPSLPAAAEGMARLLARRV